MNQNTTKILVLALGLGLSAQAWSLNYVPTIFAPLGPYTLDCGHWYVGANLGLSHTHDDRNPNSVNTVDQNGVGGSALAGYQWNSNLGTELGYTYYTNSREYFASTIVAKTQHYAVDLAATGRLEMAYRLSALGKLGVAYSYAQKMAIGSGVAQSSGSVSPYWGLGLDYSITPHVDAVLQFAEAAGNHLTGSTDLWSIGFTWAIV
jgi:outer membrane protein W